MSEEVASRKPLLLRQGVNSVKDRRYWPRWEADSRVVCKIGRSERAVECRSMDLSCSGASLVMIQELPVKDRLRLKIYLTGRTAVDLDAEMCWQRQSLYGHLIGVHFQNADEAAHELILKHAFQIKRQDLACHWFDGWSKNPAR